MAAYLTVLTTTGSEESAHALARAAVKGRLAACAQIEAPITSVYRWRGEIHTDPEWRVHLKTTDARYPALEALLLETHPYDVPEIIATAIDRGSDAYLRWLDEETDTRR
ncbi:divalent-cation tolerance protein CutA [Streptomyces profundus]|uniref:divalent-cation tolerance protein CutA n=1 Tax=Streptomyces profundus TaxID=2867410 RepID=UPI001D163EFB|nr:divalent-cation tolerance protein CutA [Streptomyces sp. MA3_2.13]UED83944.1 divalent-cation tolerance protein CutA [Streptomyces sp. MA3_2.13]